MPAKTRYRINEAGVYSHIYNKGIEKRTIFKDEEDYRVFLSFLEDYLAPRKDPESVKREFEINGHTYRGTPHQPKNYFNEVELIAYGLSPDHFHLLLHQITPGSLEKLLRSLFTRYSMYFNKKYQRAGALFEGPYKSVQIEDESRLLLLTRFLHNTEGYSSYAEYLGERETLWVKPKVVQSFFDKAKTDLFKGTHSYKDFVEKYTLDQNAKKLLEGLTFDSGTQSLERIDPSMQGSAQESSAPREEIVVPSVVKSRSRVPHFIALSTALYLLLIGVGLRNLGVSPSKESERLLSFVQSNLDSSGSRPSTQVLHANTEAKNPALKPSPTITIILTPTPSLLPMKPKESVKVKITDGLSFINIRLLPDVKSNKIAEAHDGDTFELVSQNKGWYEIRLEDGSTGFISAKYLVKEEVKK